MISLLARTFLEKPFLIPTYPYKEEDGDRCRRCSGIVEDRCSRSEVLAGTVLVVSDRDSGSRSNPFGVAEKGHFLDIPWSSWWYFIDNSYTETVSLIEKKKLPTKIQYEILNLFENFNILSILVGHHNNELISGQLAHIKLFKKSLLPVVDRRQIEFAAAFLPPAPLYLVLILHLKDKNLVNLVQLGCLRMSEIR